MSRSFVALLAAGFGFVLWLACMGLLHREPWDISLGGYCLALALAGAACVRLARPPRAHDVWRWPACIVLGELGYMLIRPDGGSLWPLALTGLAALGLAAVLGAALARLAMRRREAA
ncbi:hypothetical protein QMK61_03830 [Fulvimonas sp. R45]|uniref:hypothetical protein n=1 Tax=Fulvimonas sp. R45 TaxID=3045937 RepID=UPI00265FC782|nr:hypothetical protein [Fulvimonas sp. R45]MDO1527954.1 hypothetical protein [Fulvimonas sp. R45]